MGKPDESRNKTSPSEVKAATLGGHAAAGAKQVVYVRARIKGTLICESDLHVGDGEAKEFSKRCPEAQDEEGTYATICLNGDGKPYLPASTLRGFLRDLAARYNADLVKRLFGFVKREEGRRGFDQTLDGGHERGVEFAQGEEGQRGAVRVYDAILDYTPGHTSQLPYPDPRKHTAIRHGVAIDPITATALAHKLFRLEYVPEGSKFSMELEADCITHDDLVALVGCLAAWNRTVAARVGKGASRGMGRLRWETAEVKVLTEEKLKEWLESNQEDGLDAMFEKITVSPPELPARLMRTASFTITALSPLLVHEPGYVKDAQGEPDHEYSRLPDGKAVIPAASLRGMVRARARRIVATLSHARGVAVEKAGAKAEELIGELFGRTRWRSPLWISDAVGTDKAAEHVQTFNAIDRFTGGVAGEKGEGKLYSVRAAGTCTLEGEIALEADRKPQGDWWKGLLLLVLRDALEGDLAIGWGKAKGYGALQFQLHWNNIAILNWAGLKATLKKHGEFEEARGWITALHRRVGEMIADKTGQVAQQQQSG